MIMADHPFSQRGLNPRDENGNEGCSTCGRSRAFHPRYGDPIAKVLRPLPPDQRPVVVTQAQRRALAAGRPTTRSLDPTGVAVHLRRAWAALKPPPPPNPVTGERPGYVPPK